MPALVTQDQVKNLYDLRVAHILDDYRVVLNAGGQDGVQPGMSFVIFEEGPEIVDPATGKSLGALENVKGRVWVHHAAPAHAVAGSSQKESMPGTVSLTSMNIARALGGANALLNVKVNDRVKRVS